MPGGWILRQRDQIAGLIEMLRLSCVIILLTLLGVSSVCAGEIASFRELESFFYADGKLERFEGRYECVYFMEGDTITRIKVFDSKTNETHLDKTIFYIERQLRSDPSKGLAARGRGVVRAVGRPGIDGVEILSITGEFLMSVKSTSDFFEISRSMRVR